MKRKPTMHEAKQQSTGNEFKKLKNIDRQSESSEADGVAQEAFIFLCPELDDCDGMRELLQYYLDTEEWDLNGFADLILGEPTVSTLGKLGGEGNQVFSITSALNLERYKDQKCIKELKEFLLTRCLEKDKEGDLIELLEDKAQDMCILVSERVRKVRDERLSSLYRFLFDQLLEATKNEATEEIRNSLRSEFYILVTKVYVPKDPYHIRLFNVIKVDKKIYYIKAEDELFHGLSMWSFLFPLQIQKIEKLCQLTGIVMVLTKVNIESFREQLLEKSS